MKMGRGYSETYTLSCPDAGPEFLPDYDLEVAWRAWEICIKHSRRNPRSVHGHASKEITVP